MFNLFVYFSENKAFQIFIFSNFSVVQVICFFRNFIFTTKFKNISKKNAVLSNFVKVPKV